MQMRIDVVKRSFMENYADQYKKAGFSEEECVETIAKQFHVGKKVVREIVRRIYQETSK